MRKEPIYNGKKISQMTLEELKNQLSVNHKRSIIRAVFLLVTTVIAIDVYPISAIVPVICLVITQCWIIQNNARIKNELENRYK